MASRYPRGGNENRFAARGRSPPRFADRRTSVPNSNFQSRNTDSSYRTGEESFNGPARDLPREPPRGPKGLYDGGRGVPFTPRGRGGFGPRGRGTFDTFSRRDSDRSWPDRRDTFDDRRPSPIGRGRSRSPSFREVREPPDAARNFDSPTDLRNRGGFGGRVRGTFERGRARPAGLGDRDRFRPRSRSREKFSDADARELRFDRDSSRRDDERWDRERDHRRGLEPLRADTRGADDVARNTSPSTASSVSGAFGHGPSQDAPLNRSIKPLSETARRASLPASNHPDFRVRDDQRQPHSALHPPSSPPQAPSVPAYGSTSAILSDAVKNAQSFVANQRLSEDQKTPATLVAPAAPPIPTAPRADTLDPLKDAPKAPKADLAKGPVQNVRRSMSNTMSSGRPFDNHDSRPSGAVVAPQIPSGPRALTGASTYGPNRSLTMDSGLSQSNSTFGAHASRIPTGPKALSMPSTKNLPTSNVWVRSSGRPPPAGPAALTSGTTAKRELPDEAKQEAVQPTDGERSAVVAPNAESIETQPEHELPVKVAPESRPEDQMEMDEKAQEHVPQVIAEPPADSDLPFLQSEDEDVISEDDHMSEEDLRAQEAKFACQKLELEARRPPPDHEDSELLLMLDELDALAVALDDHEQGRWPPPGNESVEEQMERESQGADALHDQFAPKPPVIQIRSIMAQRMASIELSDEDEELEDGLPYKPSSPPTPMSQLSLLRDEHKEFETHRHQLLQCLSVRIKHEDDEMEKLRLEFSQHFHLWRDKVDALDRDRDRQAAEEAQAAAEAAAVAQQEELPPLPTSSVESSRGRRAFNTQLELDQALALSKQTHAEEQARAKEAEHEALTAPDLTKEAVIPSMLSSRMQEMVQYQDCNTIIETNKALEVFKFVPPEDDFTPEEHELFKKAYQKNERKQFGHIALEIPGRTYKECIMHYYLTKRDAKYKRLLHKKVARARKISGKGKTNALMSDLASRPEGDQNGKVEVTDTGRPKRAAAPTNFDRRQQSEVETTPQRRGRVATQAKTTEGSDGGADKPKRGRATKDKSLKRSKGITAVPAVTTVTTAGPGPGKKMLGIDGASELMTEDTPRQVGIADAQLLADLRQNPAHFPVTLVQAGHTENWLNTPPTYPQPVQMQHDAPRDVFEQQIPRFISQDQPMVMQNEHVMTPAAQEPDLAKSIGITMTGPAKRSGPGASGRNANTSSYWSVDEQKRVSDMIPHLGSDWDEYAARLPQKTATMVKNYVNRLMSDGTKNPNLSAQLKVADDQNKSNPRRKDTLIEDGLLDAPGAPQAPPSQRPLAPGRKVSGEVKQEREDRPVPKSRADLHIAVAPKPPGPQQIHIPNELQPNRPRNKSNVSTKSTASSSAQQPLPGFTGPRAGYFDVPSISKETMYTASPYNNDPRQVPTVNVMSNQEAQPSEQSKKWTIPTSYTPRDAVAREYNTHPGVHPRLAAKEEPQAMSISASVYAHESPFSRIQERTSLAPAVSRYEMEHPRVSQGQVQQAQTEDRQIRMGIHFEPGAVAYQPRATEMSLQPPQAGYSHGRDSRDHRDPGRPVISSSLQAILSEPQTSRPSSTPPNPTYDTQVASQEVRGTSSLASAPVSAPAIAPAPSPAPTKRLNIMSILNDDPEPAPKRITTDSRAPAPVPTPPVMQAPIPPPPYQPLSQSYQYSARPSMQGYNFEHSTGRQTPTERPKMHSGVQQVQHPTFDQQQRHPIQTSMQPPQQQQQQQYSHTQSSAASYDPIGRYGGGPPGGPQQSQHQQNPFSQDSRTAVQAYAYSTQAPQQYASQTRYAPESSTTHSQGQARTSSPASYGQPRNAPIGYPSPADAPRPGFGQSNISGQMLQPGSSAAAPPPYGYPQHSRPGSGFQPQGQYSVSPYGHVPYSDDRMSVPSRSYTPTSSHAGSGYQIPLQQQQHPPNNRPA